MGLEREKSAEYNCFPRILFRSLQLFTPAGRPLSVDDEQMHLLVHKRLAAKISLLPICFVYPLRRTVLIVSQYCITSSDPKYTRLCIQRVLKISTPPTLPASYSRRMSFDETYDVVVVGGGNAGFSAATTAAQLGSRVLLLEKAPQSDAGGNTFFTAGAYRTCFGGLDDLLPIIYKEDGTKGLPRTLVEKIDIKPYTSADFHADIKRVCKGRADPELARVLVDGSREAVQWIADLGGKWALSFNRQAFEVDGRFKFWGGMVMAFLGTGFSSLLSV